jgi:hypothetical protein
MFINWARIDGPEAAKPEQALYSRDEAFDNPRQFIEVLRNRVDETSAEYRLRA